MIKQLARFALWIGRWSVDGEIPDDKKAIILSAPHTSSWDFVWGELCFLRMGMHSYTLMKKEYFFFPLGNLLKALRVIPVDRGRRDSNLIQTLVEEFSKRDHMYLCITPEGSRKKRKQWKKGFLVIAAAANVPIYLGRIDYKNRTCSFGARFESSGDIDADLKAVMDSYADANPKYPEHFSNGN